MQDRELQNHMDFLLSMALRKCGNLADAQDLTQETLLAALVYLNKGASIEDWDAWLLTVMNRRYYDSLRRKYRLASVTFGEDFDIADERDYTDEYLRREEADEIRREVAHLSETYRTIITRHYFYKDRISDIARLLKLPEGTVKSRLNFGRKQLRKGFETMKNYTENSYSPQILILRNSGSCGLNDEPMSLVPDDDRLSQNLLLLAYEKPVGISELSKAIGVSAAYIEPVIDRLVDGELMKRMGDGRVYTDFIIYDHKDFSDAASHREQEQFAASHATLYCDPMAEAIRKLRQTPFYSRRLERYMLIHIAATALYRSLEAHRAPQVFPDRPNGGRWIAFATRYESGTDVSQIPEQTGKAKYMLSGERRAALAQYLDARDLSMHNYESSLYPYANKTAGFGYLSFQESESDMLKLFYLIAKGIAPETVDADPRILKAIPLLEERGFLQADGKRVRLLVPCLTHSQQAQFLEICGLAVKEILQRLSEPLAEYIRYRKKQIPPHLKSVPDAKLSLPFEPHAMMLVDEAIKRGLHPRDLGFPCPETYVVFD